jgi:hypothetical protein
MKVMKEGIYKGQNTTILCFFVLGDHVYFEIVYDDSNPMEGFKTGRLLFYLIGILIYFGRNKLKEYAAIMGGRVW